MIGLLASRAGESTGAVVGTGVAIGYVTHSVLLHRIRTGRCRSSWRRGGGREARRVGAELGEHRLGHAAFDAGDRGTSAGSTSVRLHESLADIPSAAFEPLHQDAAGASLRSLYGLAALPPATKLTTS